MFKSLICVPDVGKILTGLFEKLKVFFNNPTDGANLTVFYILVGGLAAVMLGILSLIIGVSLSSTAKRAAKRQAEAKRAALKNAEERRKSSRQRSRQYAGRAYNPAGEAEGGIPEAFGADTGSFGDFDSSPSFLAPLGGDTASSGPVVPEFVAPMGGVVRDEPSGAVLTLDGQVPDGVILDIPSSTGPVAPEPIQAPVPEPIPAPAPAPVPAPEPPAPAPAAPFVPFAGPEPAPANSAGDFPVFTPPAPVWEPEESVPAFEPEPEPEPAPKPKPRRRPKPVSDRPRRVPTGAEISMEDGGWKAARIVASPRPAEPEEPVEEYEEEYVEEAYEEEEPAPKKPAPAKPAPKKPAPKKPAPKKAPAKAPEPEDEDEDEDKPKVTGKFVLENTDTGCQFVLYANNGQLLFRSHEYASPSSCKGGVATFKKNIPDCEYRISEDKSGGFKFVFKKGNTLYHGDVYTSKASAESAAESVKRFAAVSEISK